ncbi:MAG: hypothetical protein RhofKO_31890 [Rhodothermales bacterium]
MFEDIGGREVPQLSKRVARVCDECLLHASSTRDGAAWVECCCDTFTEALAGTTGMAERIT